MKRGRKVIRHQDLWLAVMGDDTHTALAGIETVRGGRGIYVRHESHVIRASVLKGGENSGMFGQRNGR